MESDAVSPASPGDEDPAANPLESTSGAPAGQAVLPGEGLTCESVDLALSNLAALLVRSETHDLAGLAQARDTLLSLAADPSLTESIRLALGQAGARLGRIADGSSVAAEADFGEATRLLDQAGIPLILVGDSLGMVVLGYPDTTHVTMAEMEHHVRAAARAKPRALLAADLPYRSYETVESAVATARRLADAGAEAVKAEGGVAIEEQVRAIVRSGIPFLGHLGMLPQHVLEEGGYRV